MCKDSSQVKCWYERTAPMIATQQVKCVHRVCETECARFDAAPHILLAPDESSYGTDSTVCRPKSEKVCACEKLTGTRVGGGKCVTLRPNDREISRSNRILKPVYRTLEYLMHVHTCLSLAIHGGSHSPSFLCCAPAANTNISPSRI